jgi:hypothetical protein
LIAGGPGAERSQLEAADVLLPQRMETMPAQMLHRPKGESGTSAGMLDLLAVLLAL